MADTDTVITPYRDGPLLVRGPFRLVDQNGDEIEVSGREGTTALCRCGKSRLRLHDKSKWNNEYKSE